MMLAQMNLLDKFENLDKTNDNKINKFIEDVLEIPVELIK